MCIGHSLSYRQENAMTWTVSFHFPSNNVVLPTRKYSNKLQPIYNNSLTLNLFAPKNKKNNLLQILQKSSVVYPQLQIPLSIKVWNIQVCFIQNLLLSDFLKLHMKDEQMKVIFVFLWLWESMNSAQTLMLLFARRTLSFCRSQKRGVFM